MRPQSYHLPAFLIMVGFLAMVIPAKSTAATLQPIPSPDISIHKLRSNADRPTRPLGDKYRGKIWDTHVHLDPPSKKSREGGVPDDLLTALEKAGIERINIMPTPNEGIRDKQKFNPKGGTAGREALRVKAASQVRVFCGAESMTAWMGKAAGNGYEEKDFQQRMTALGNALDNRRCNGIGEIGLFHFRKWGRQHVLEIPPTFPPFLSLFQMAARRGAWVDFHAEPVEPEGKSREDEIFGAIALLYQKNPTLKLILSHTAMTNPTNLRALFEFYPGLMVNFKLVRWHTKWRNLEPICDTQGRLYEDWAALMEAYPNRFLVGTDFKFGRKGFKLEMYQEEIEVLRTVLGSLIPDVAEKLAWNNAVRNFGN